MATLGQRGYVGPAMPGSSEQLPPQAGVRIVVGLGSNLGDRLAFLRLAADALAALGGVDVVSRSGVVETAAVGGPAQPDFLNAAVALSTALAPMSLLESALAIERRLGRCRPDAVRWGPRTIDIDLLWMPGVTVRQPGLKIPHPRLTERPFALQPLLELVPDATDPVTGERYDTLPAARAALTRVAIL